MTIPAAEHTRAFPRASMPARRSKGAPRLAEPSQWKCKLVAAAVATCFSTGVALANPAGPTVVAGQASFRSQGNTLSVTNSTNAIIQWQSFSIGPAELTRFIQPSASSAVLNRVVGSIPSELFGALQSNGRVFIINPSGILVGAGAQIDVAGLVVSTLNLTNEDFLAGRLRFADTPGAGNIVNQGAIRTAARGNVYLIAPNIENSGVITSPEGEIILAAGRSVELVDAGTPSVRVLITAPDGQAVNLGSVIARSGRIGIYAGLINQKGLVNADTAIVGENGQIVFKAKDITLASGSVTTASGTPGGVKDGGEVRIVADGTLDMRQGAEVHVDGGVDGGNGGFLELSGKQNMFLNQDYSVRARKSGYRGGTLLIDPTDLEFCVTVECVVAGATRIDPAAINVSGAASVTFAASNNITVSSPITAANLRGGAPSLGTSLTLAATNDAAINAGISFAPDQSLHVTAGHSITTLSNAAVLRTIQAGTIDFRATNGGITVGSGTTLLANNSSVGAAVNLLAGTLTGTITSGVLTTGPGNVVNVHGTVQGTAQFPFPSVMIVGNSISVDGVVQGNGFAAVVQALAADSVTLGPASPTTFGITASTHSAANTLDLAGTLSANAAQTGVVQLFGGTVNVHDTGSVGAAAANLGGLATVRVAALTNRTAGSGEVTNHSTANTATISGVVRAVTNRGDASVQIAGGMVSIDRGIQTVNPNVEAVGLTADIAIAALSQGADPFVGGPPGFTAHTTGNALTVGTGALAANATGPGSTASVGLRGGTISVGGTIDANGQGSGSIFAFAGPRLLDSGGTFTINRSGTPLPSAGFDIQVSGRMTATAGNSAEVDIAGAAVGILGRVEALGATKGRVALAAVNDATIGKFTGTVDSVQGAGHDINLSGVVRTTGATNASVEMVGDSITVSGGTATNPNVDLAAGATGGIFAAAATTSTITGGSLTASTHNATTNVVNVPGWIRGAAGDITVDVVGGKVNVTGGLEALGTTAGKVTVAALTLAGIAGSSFAVTMTPSNVATLAGTVRASQSATGAGGAQVAVIGGSVDQTGGSIEANGTLQARVDMLAANAATVTGGGLIGGTAFVTGNTVSVAGAVDASAVVAPGLGRPANVILQGHDVAIQQTGSVSAGGNFAQVSLATTGGNITVAGALNVDGGSGRGSALLQANDGNISVTGNITARESAGFGLAEVQFQLGTASTLTIGPGAIVLASNTSTQISASAGAAVNVFGGSIDFQAGATVDAITQRNNASVAFVSDGGVTVGGSIFANAPAGAASVCLPCAGRGTAASVTVLPGAQVLAVGNNAGVTANAKGDISVGGVVSATAGAGGTANVTLGGRSTTGLVNVLPGGQVSALGGNLGQVLIITAGDVTLGGGVNATASGTAMIDVLGHAVQIQPTGNVSASGNFAPITLTSNGGEITVAGSVDAEAGLSEATVSVTANGGGNISVTGSITAHDSASSGARVSLGALAGNVTIGPVAQVLASNTRLGGFGSALVSVTGTGPVSLGGSVSAFTTSRRADVLVNGGSITVGGAVSATAQGAGGNAQVNLDAGVSSIFDGGSNFSAVPGNSVNVLGTVQASGSTATVHLRGYSITVAGGGTVSAAGGAGSGGSGHLNITAMTGSNTVFGSPGSFTSTSSPANTIDIAGTVHAGGKLATAEITGGAVTIRSGGVAQAIGVTDAAILVAAISGTSSNNANSGTATTAPGNAVSVGGTVSAQGPSATIGVVGNTIDVTGSVTSAGGSGSGALLGMFAANSLSFAPSGVPHVPILTAITQDASNTITVGGGVSATATGTGPATLSISGGDITVGGSISANAELAEAQVLLTANGGNIAVNGSVTAHDLAGGVAARVNLDASAGNVVVGPAGAMVTASNESLGSGQAAVLLSAGGAISVGAGATVSAVAPGFANVAASANGGGITESGLVSATAKGTNGRATVTLTGLGGGAAFIDVQPGGEVEATAPLGGEVLGAATGDITVGGSIYGGLAGGSAGGGVTLIAGGAIVGAGGTIDANVGDRIILTASNGIGAIGAPIRILDGQPNVTVVNSVSGDIVITQLNGDMVIGVTGLPLPPPSGFSLVQNAGTGGVDLSAATGNVLVQGPLFGSNSFIRLGSAGAITVSGSVNNSLGSVFLQAPGAVAVQPGASVFAGQDIGINAGTFSVQGASVFAGRDMTALATGPITVTDGFLSAGSNMGLTTLGNLTIEGVSSPAFVSANFITGTVGGDVIIKGTGALAEMSARTDIGSTTLPLTIFGSLRIDGIGGDARMETGSPDSIHLFFPNLASGGVFVNGVEGQISSDFTGIFVNGNPAVVDTNLFITFGVSPTPQTFDVLSPIVGQINDSTNFNVPSGENPPGGVGPGEDESQKKKRPQICS